MSDSRPALAQLAERVGIYGSYHEIDGTYRPTSDATREALCAAMGYACGTESEASASLESLDAAAAAERIAAVQVILEGEPLALRVRLWPSASASAAELRIRGEDESLAAQWVELPASEHGGAVELPLPALAAGVYELELASRELHAQTLVVVPRTAYRAEEALGDGRALGVWTNLYTVRSQSNWGFGDFGDLNRLVRELGPLGVDFVALNPLHALANRGDAIAPYSPVSRIYANPLYLDVTAVPEFASCESARALAAAQPLAALRATDSLDHAAVLAAKLAVLHELHRAAKPRVAPPEPELADFATFEVLCDSLGERDWRRWPAALREPRSSEVACFAREHAAEISFRAFLQQELDAQLDASARAARAAGMRVGLSKDLAIGSAPDSADTWMCRELFADGASLGAPPDAYAAAGQDWGLPPLLPGQLRAGGYRFLRRLFRAAFRGAGALRIDHVMGHYRQFWIPAGRPPSEGTYVVQNAPEQLGVLALESRRARALVVGEDLGTVPPELAPELESRGILSMRVLCFERDGIEFRPSDSYLERALALAVTHDLPPLAGWLEGRELELRAAIAGRSESLAGELAFRAAERDALARRLRAEGLLAGDGPWSTETLVGAAQLFLAGVPSRLAAVSLDDLAGEREPLNLPGIPVEVHRSWSRRMARELEALLADPALRALLRSAATRVNQPHARPEGIDE